MFSTATTPFPFPVLVVGDTLPPGALESLRRSGLAVVFSPMNPDLLPALSPRCVIVCSHNGHGPDLCQTVRGNSFLREVPILLIHPSGAGCSAADAVLGARVNDGDLAQRVLSLLRDPAAARSAPDGITDAARFQVLAQAGRELLYCPRPEDYFTDLFEQIRRLLRVDLFLNYLFEEETGRLQLHCHGGIEAGTEEAIQWLEPGQAVCGTVARERRSLVVESVQQSTDPKTELIRSLGVQAYACFPLRGTAGLRGTVSFGSRSRSSFAASELDLMAGIADLAGVALDRFSLLTKLEAKAEALEASNRGLEEFAYAVSHDLREPLRSISAFTDLLARRAKATPGDELTEVIGMIKGGTSRMAEVIDAVLRFSHASGSPAGSSERLDLTSLAREALLNLSAAIRSADAEVTLEPLPVVHGDRTLLVQLFQNLIANAIKYCGPCAPRIRIGCAVVESATALYIRDNGIGIDPESHAAIFGIFKRLHTQARYPGDGIGLAVAKKIVERHGGRIWVESEPGEGSTFWFTLSPAAKKGPERTEASANSQ